MIVWVKGQHKQNNHSEKLKSGEGLGDSEVSYGHHEYCHAKGNMKAEGSLVTIRKAEWGGGGGAKALYVHSSGLSFKGGEALKTHVQ